MPEFVNEQPMYENRPIPTDEQAERYYQHFLDLARREQNPTPQLTEMMGKAEETLKYYRTSRR